MKKLYDDVSGKISKITTLSYSTSFSLGIKVFKKRFHEPIYAIYGFVRLADEIVDSFHDYNKRKLLDQFREDTYEAIEEGISVNPVLNSFQNAVRKYKIEKELIDTFLNSMEMDLDKTAYDEKNYKRYILGSAEVVGLMCLRVFVEGDEEKYYELKDNAMSLGSAFQKINFLRDLSADFHKLGRTYFPGVDMHHFDEHTKRMIENDIERDFKKGFEGIKKLPKSVRLGVYLAYVYYYQLFKKIRKSPSNRILKERIRVKNRYKYLLLIRSYFEAKLEII